MSSKEYHKERRSRLKAQGLCIQCGVPASNKVLCDTHYEKSRLRTNIWKERNREKFLQVKRNNYLKTKEHQSNIAIQRKYGISLQEKNHKLIEQNFKCEICHSDITISSHIDHNHRTKKVRGLLCGSCNRLLGLAKENSEILLSANQYLIKYRE